MHAVRTQFVTGLKCIHCGRTYATEEVDYYCPACGYHDGILDVQYDYVAVREELNADALAVNRELSMWRYLPLLPVSSPDLIPHLQVGWTPLYEAPRLIRVRVATAILNTGKVTADQNCTRHWHSDQNTCAQ